MHRKLPCLKKTNLWRRYWNKIRAQTGYDFLFKTETLKQVKNVSIQVTNAELKEVLDELLSAQRLEYSIDDTSVIISKKQPSFLNRLYNALRAIDVYGIVLDENNLPLAGASVKVKQGTASTTSNTYGEFFLKDVDENSVLVISFIGYESQEVKAAKNIAPVKLMLRTDKLEEVEINAGYYTVKERERTGSISRVNGTTISNQPVSNPVAALIGRMPGVNIEQQSGVNGGGFSIEIRGRNSLRSDGWSPLILVDGIPYPSSGLNTLPIVYNGFGSPLNYINPADIESVEVLKDADATAIYGSRGSNGVILIRTKSAKMGKFSIDLNMYAGISQVPGKLDLLNTQQYLEMRNEAFKNDNAIPGPTAYDINGTWDQNRYTDWQKVLIGGTAHNTNLQANLAGGNEFTQFSLRGGYNRQTSVYPVDCPNERGTGTFSLNHSTPNQKLKVTFSAAYSLDDNALPANDLAQYITLAPNAPTIYESNNKLNWELNSSGASTWDNPLAYTLRTYRAATDALTTNAMLSYEFFPGLSVKSNLGYTIIKLKESLLTPISSFAPGSPSRGSNRVAYNNVRTWIIEPQVNYHKTIGKSKLDILVGSTFQKNDLEEETVAGSGYTSDLLLESLVAAPTKGATSSATYYKYNAVFARINYNYQSKYLINLTGRRDGSSRFGPGKQFANFGAIGAAWVFSDESFIRLTFPGLSFGKLRSSYGITGSDQIGDYGYISTYSASTQPYQDGSGVNPNRLSNPDYSWETNKKLEFALDLGFLKDKILFSASWYRNRSSDQLVGYPLPDITGFTSIQYNLPATVENNGWEFELNTTNIKKTNFSWRTSANLTIPRNKLIAFPNIKGSIYNNSLTIGHSIYAAKAYNYLGVDPQTGIYTYEDLNGTNSVESGDLVSPMKALTSQLYGGLQNGFTYKNFQLDVFFQFVKKTVRNPLYQFGAAGLGLVNQPIQVMDRWQVPGDETEIPRFSQSSSNIAIIRTTYLVSSNRFQDASFIRLKNVSASWNFPSSITKKIGLNTLRVYIQGQNLLTFTKYVGDPESMLIKSLPTLRTMTMGLQVGI